MTADICHICNREEREPWTLARFSILVSCRRCEEPTCSNCGDNDGDLQGGEVQEWVGTRVCNRCLAISKANRMNSIHADE